MKRELLHADTIHQMQIAECKMLNELLDTDPVKERTRAGGGGVHVGRCVGLGDDVAFDAGE